MKLNDFIFRFLPPGRCAHPGICRVRLFVNQKAEVYAVLTELDETPSSSVTNEVEWICHQLIGERKIPSQARIIEHYPTCHAFPQTFDLVTLRGLQRSEWRSLSGGTVLKWLECEPEEFSADNQSDPHLKAEIQQALEGLPALPQFRWTEPPEISERRLEIAANQHSRADLNTLLESRPNEQTLSAFLKEDPSLLAEQYAYPKEEYICFSEFPVGDTGRADFALFTGRSRMDVYLIELKGANLPLCRANHYGAFRAAIQEGRDQLIRRGTWIRQNDAAFRRFVHQTRLAVQEGKRPYRLSPVLSQHCRWTQKRTSNCT